MSGPKINMPTTPKPNMNNEKMMRNDIKSCVALPKVIHSKLNLSETCKYLNTFKKESRVLPAAILAFNWKL